MSRRTLAFVISLMLAVPLGAAPAAAAQAAPWPSRITLPANFQPEGIAIGDRPYAFLGSQTDGDIYRVDLRTGRGSVISPGRGAGHPSFGLALDDDRLFVAGGPAGEARVVDLRTGKVLKSYAMRAPGASTWLINDVVLAGGAAWFTDSTNPVLWKLPLGPDGGLPARAVAVPLTGDIEYVDDLNANGITRTPDGRGLIVVQSFGGRLFRVGYDGRTTRIELDSNLAAIDGDGMELRGTTLRVVLARNNVISRIELDPEARTGRLISRTENGDFDIPTAIAGYGNRIYLPNARYTTRTIPPPSEFWITVMPRP